MLRTVSVTLNVNNQIELTIGTESRAGECYYLGLQTGCEAEFNPRRGVARLIARWIDLLADLEDGEQVFLPFDFSDEFTRWLTARCTKEELTLVIGWAPVEGWAISPDDFSAHAMYLPGFHADEPLVAQSFYAPRVLADLRRSLEALSPT